jgi:hypothetical protein
MPKFYLFDARISYNRSTIKIQSDVEYDTLTPLTKDSILVENNTFTVDKGKKWFDIIEFADSTFFAISENVKELFEREKFTGWGCFPIAIKGHEDKNYYAFYVDAFVGEFTNSEAQLEDSDVKIEFDLSTYKGTDFFSNEGTLLTACTERVKEIIEKNKFTNVEFGDY